LLSLFPFDYANPLTCTREPGGPHGYADTCKTSSVVVAFGKQAKKLVPVSGCVGRIQVHSAEERHSRHSSECLAVADAQKLVILPNTVFQAILMDDAHSAEGEGRLRPSERAPGQEPPSKPASPPDNAGSTPPRQQAAHIPGNETRTPRAPGSLQAPEALPRSRPERQQNRPHNTCAEH